MCLYPKLIQNRKYVKNKKNGGVIPAFSDDRVLAVAVGCGRCMECMKKKAREWQVRLLEDVRHNKNGKFVTLTFSDESIREITEDMPSMTRTVIYDRHGNRWNEESTGRKIKKKEKIYDPMPEGYELDNAIATVAMRRFNERWRKENKKAVRHWMVTELGHEGTENIHMHGIVWTDNETKEIEKHWKYGYVWIGEYVSERTVNYITKYVHKMDNDHKEYKAKILTSAGIGAKYIDREDAKNNKYKEGETREAYVTRTGDKMAMPIYWRNKIYTDEEREKLWLEKLDKKVRWVGKIKVDVSEGEEKYYKLLQEAQEKARRLGYQNNETDWERKRYEEDRRRMLTQKRIERAWEKSDPSGGSGGRQPESVNDHGLQPKIEEQSESERGMSRSKEWD